MRGLARPLALLVEERGLVDEHFGLAGRLEDDRRGSRIARDDELSAGARRAEHLVGRDDDPLVQLDRIAALEQAPLARVDAESVGGLDVEAARPRLLDERVADRRDTVRRREGGQVVAVALDHCTRLQLLEP